MISIIRNLFQSNTKSQIQINDSIEKIKTLSVLNALFVGLLLIDIIIRAITTSWPLMFSSIILVIFLLIARYYIIKKSNLERSGEITGLIFYFIAIYHSHFTQEIIIPYFILLLTPILSTLILRSLRTKIIFFVLSSIFFFICNYLANLHLLDNSLFFIGLIPSFFAVVYFYNQLSNIELQKNQLIEELKVKNEDMLLFSQMMGHDLKAPLRAIFSFSTLLKRKINQDDKRQVEYLDLVMNNAENMKQLIDDLLVYSKVTTDEYDFEVIDLDKLIEYHKLTFQYAIQNEKLIINEEKLGSIIGNKSALNTVFQNLISNAIKYQPLNKEHHIPSVSISIERSNDTMAIYFKDNGIGIKKENVDKMFTPFTRFHAVSKYKGTGLGLSICKKILNKHNGDISVFSSDENGTCFQVQLPTTLKEISK